MNSYKKLILSFTILLMVSSFLIGCGGSEVTTEKAVETNFKVTSYLNLSENFFTDENVEKELEVMANISLRNQKGVELDSKDVVLNTEQQEFTFSKKSVNNNESYKLVAFLAGEKVAEKEIGKINAEIIGVELIISDLGGVNINSIPAVLTPQEVEVNNHNRENKTKATINWERRKFGNYPFRQQYVIYRTKEDHLDDYPDTKPDESSKVLVSQFNQTEYVDDNVEEGETYYYWLQGQSLSNRDYVSRVTGPYKITVSDNIREEIIAPEITYDDKFKDRDGNFIGEQPYGAGHNYQPYYREIALNHGDDDVIIQYKIGSNGEWKEYIEPFTISGEAQTWLSSDNQAKISYRAYNPETENLSTTITRYYKRTILEVQVATEPGEEVYFHYQTKAGEWTQVPGRKGEYIKDGVWQFVIWEQENSFEWIANINGEEWLKIGNRTASPGEKSSARW